MKRAAFSIIAILLGFCLSLVLAEIVLVALGLPRFEQERESRFTGGLSFYDSPQSGHLMYRLKPHSSYLNIYSSNPRSYFDEQNTITIRANNRGFRGDNFASRTDSGIVRVAFLGDSFTMGEGVKFEDTYSEKTESLLNTDGPLVASGLRADSYNFAMFAFNTSQEYLLLLEEILPIDPDIVVLGYTLNDAAGPYFEIDPHSRKVIGDQLDPFWYGVGTHPPDRMVYRLRTAQLIWNFWLQRTRSEKTIAYYKYLYGSDNPHWPENSESLRAIIKLCESRQTPLIILCFPVLYSLDEAYPFAAIHDTVAKIVHGAAGNHTMFVDMLSIFRGLAPETLWAHPTDHHPNEKAHRLTAEVLVQTLRERPGLLEEVVARKTLQETTGEPKTSTR